MSLPPEAIPCGDDPPRVRLESPPPATPPVKPGTPSHAPHTDDQAGKVREVIRAYRALGRTRGQALDVALMAARGADPAVSTDAVLRMLEEVFASGGVTDAPAATPDVTSDGNNQPPPVSLDVTQRNSAKPRNSTETQRTSTSVVPSAGNSADAPSRAGRGKNARKTQQSEASGRTLIDHVRRVTFEHRTGEREYTGFETDLWNWMRLVKSHDELFPLNAKAAWKKLDATLKGMLREYAREHEGQQGRDHWEAYLGVGSDDAEQEVLDGWDKIRYVPGQDFLSAAFRQARAHPLSLCAEVMSRSSRKYPLFVSLCGWAQVARGALPVALPVEPIGEILEVEKMTITRYRRQAIADGYLLLVSESPGKKSRRANEYVFDVRKWDALEQRAQPGTAELWDRIVRRGNG